MMVRILLASIIVSLLVPVLLLGCNETDTPKEEVDMFLDVAKPVIDAHVPTEIETATFALG